ncbi:MAG TPA: phosphatase PAP2 family protein [Pseudonocardia sp.]|nr:phosphatase PAP2 family protein [Pseudonocardia sp.]
MTWAVIAALAVALAVLTGAVAAGWAPLEAADARVVLAADTAMAAHAGGVAVAIAVTDVGSPVAVDVFTAVAVVVLLLCHRGRDAVYLALVRVAVLGVENGLKILLARPRPDVVPPLTSATGFSFPSGHTSGTTALCVSLLVVLFPVLHRRGRAVAVVAAVALSVAVAASRVLLGVHFPSDVIGGLLTGTLVALTAAALLLPSVPETVPR